MGSVAGAKERLVESGTYRLRSTLWPLKSITEPPQIITKHWVKILEPEPSRAYVTIPKSMVSPSTATG
ncbi:hypothetical protein RUM43_008307 [Polyplax serrata]|uniref:Uncharacterized protein n=1 Tax=Polyplax serrata TaxID=468196 RepID=A0AAN8P6V7_POLSC